MHALTLASHVAWMPAVGRGIFIWLALRGLIHAVGWPITLAVFAVVAVVATYAKQRRS